MAFLEIIGGFAILFYILAIIFKHVGFGCLALGLTIYTIQGGGL